MADLTKKDFSTIELQEITLGLRRDIIDMCHTAGSGHPGGSLSLCEILTVLYHQVLNIDSTNPLDPDRDRLILSKGHGAPALYAVLADKGYFPREELWTLRRIGSRLQGHPVMHKLPGIEITAGSLGMGISVGLGMVLAARHSKRSYRTFVIVGDGELNEGQNWEALLAAAKYKADEMCIIVDYNKIQLDGHSDDILPLGSLKAKFKSFDCHVLECDGHDIDALSMAINESLNLKDRPSVILAHTIKGKGVSFMENNPAWHGKPVSVDDRERALAELK